MSRWDEDQEACAIEGCECIRETEKAILCRIPDALEEGDYRETWIPKSQVTDDSEVYKKGDEGTLIVTAWFARKEDLGQE
jgi:hypothetical protein